MTADTAGKGSPSDAKTVTAGDEPVVRRRRSRFSAAPSAGPSRSELVARLVARGAVDKIRRLVQARLAESEAVRIKAVDEQAKELYEEIYPLHQDSPDPREAFACLKDRLKQGPAHIRFLEDLEHAITDGNEVEVLFKEEMALIRKEYVDELQVKTQQTDANESVENGSRAFAAHDSSEKEKELLRTQKSDFEKKKPSYEGPKRISSGTSAELKANMSTKSKPEATIANFLNAIGISKSAHSKMLQSKRKPVQAKSVIRRSNPCLLTQSKTGNDRNEQKATPKPLPKAEMSAVFNASKPSTNHSDGAHEQHPPRSTVVMSGETTVGVESTLGAPTPDTEIDSALASSKKYLKSAESETGRSSRDSTILKEYSSVQNTASNQTSCDVGHTTESFASAAMGGGHLTSNDPEDPGDSFVLTKSSVHEGERVRSSMVEHSNETCHQISTRDPACESRKVAESENSSDKLNSNLACSDIDSRKNEVISESAVDPKLKNPSEAYLSENDDNMGLSDDKGQPEEVTMRTFAEENASRKELAHDGVIGQVSANKDSSVPDNCGERLNDPYTKDRGLMRRDAKIEDNPNSEKPAHELFSETASPISQKRRSDCQGPTPAASSVHISNLKAEDVCDMREEVKIDPPVDGSGLANIRQILEQICRMPEALPFLDPVDSTIRGCETYYDEIKEPRNLKSICSQLNPVDGSGHYMSVEAVLRDINLVWSNCFQFNPNRDPICELARTCKTKFEILLEKRSQTDSQPVIGRKSRRSTQGIHKRLFDAVSSADDRRQKKRTKAMEAEDAENCRNPTTTKKPRRSVLAESSGKSDDSEPGEQLVGHKLLVFCGLSLKGTDCEAVRWHTCHVLGYDATSRTHEVLWVDFKQTSRGISFATGGDYAIYKDRGLL